MTAVALTDEGGIVNAGKPGTCHGCGESRWLLPLHGEKGGPLRCFKCAGEWNARHGRERRAGRVAIKAIRAYRAAGGRDVNKLVAPAGAADFGVTLPGFEHINGAPDVTDLTSELLADLIELCHPDKHPVERKEKAERVTQQLIALRPFVFPAPKPKERKPGERDVFVEVSPKTLKEASRLSYPCSDCADEIPYFYCDACRAEWNIRQQKIAEGERAKQRKWYHARRERLRRSVTCPACREPFKQRRADQRFCSPACRQREYRIAQARKAQANSA
jgi:hypothetical protein